MSNQTELERLKADAAWEAARAEAWEAYAARAAAQTARGDAE